MKKFFAGGLILFILIGSVGCTQTKDPLDEAKKVVESFMDLIYDVEDFTVLKDTVIEKERDMEGALR